MSGFNVTQCSPGDRMRLWFCVIRVTQHSLHSTGNIWCASSDCWWAGCRIKLCTWSLMTTASFMAYYLKIKRWCRYMKATFYFALSVCPSRKKQLWFLWARHCAAALRGGKKLSTESGAELRQQHHHHHHLHRHDREGGERQTEREGRCPPVPTLHLLRRNLTARCVGYSVCHNSSCLCRGVPPWSSLTPLHVQLAQ